VGEWKGGRVGGWASGRVLGVGYRVSGVGIGWAGSLFVCFLGCEDDVAEIAAVANEGVSHVKDALTENGLGDHVPTDGDTNLI